MVMTIAKITAGDGYTYLLRHVARGDAEVTGARDAAEYYTAQGNPPGAWTGRGAPVLGVAGREVTEEQMRALFGLGSHPDSDALIAAYLKEHVRPSMRDSDLEKVRDDAIASARLGRAFPAYEPLAKFDARVAARLAVIAQEAGREPTAAEVKKVKAGEARRQRAAVAGFDLVFSPVKSAALLWALDPRPRVRDAIRAAHEGALGEALDLVEEHAAYTRTGAGGIAQVETNGLTAAAFEHWDSRAGDPNLHTHVAVSSKVQGTDGKWRALDARALHAMTVAASEAYNTAFQIRLSASLGVTFTARPDTAGSREPVREITGVPSSVIEFFSRRRAAIEARYSSLLRDYRGLHGRDPGPATAYRLARQANLDTRQGKKPPSSLTEKRAAWREELREAFGPGAVDRLMQAVPANPAEAVPDALSPASLTDLAERTVAAVSASRSTWTVWNLRAEAERQIRSAVASLPPERHRTVADRVTALAASPAWSISVESPALLDEPAGLRRSDGESVFTPHAAGRYTSQAVLDAETRLVNATMTPTARGLPGASATAALDGFEAVEGTGLDAGQRGLVTTFACDPRLLMAGIGPAGSGKTTAMRALEYVLRAGGQRLVPLATSAASADVLGRELGTRAENVHKFMHEWTAGPFAARLRSGAGVPGPARAFRLFPGDVVLVDEAGMAGTFLLDRLVQLAAVRGAVVRLLGDDRQLPAVEGGGALRLVASQPGTPHLSVLYRFRDPSEAAATLQVRDGDAAAIDWYASAGRVRSGSREAMTQAAYAAWKTDMTAGKVTLMAAAGSASVTELSARARADRVLAGQVEADGVRLRDGNLAGRGDWIVSRDNQRRLNVFGGRDWVKNGDAWQVTRRLAGGSLTVRHLGHGGTVTLPADYVRAHVQLLYATTAHRVQGATVDTAHPLISAGMTREALYVLATRAREKTVFYVATHDLPYDDDAHVDLVRRDPRQYAAREILLNVLATEGAPLSATETISTAQEEACSLATLVPRYLHAARLDAESRYRAAAIRALGDEAWRGLAADPAWGAVVRRLFDAEGEGWEPARLLATVARKRELASADSVAEVLAWRIDAFRGQSPGSPSPAGGLPPQPTGGSTPGQGEAAYENAAQARRRLTALAVAVMGDDLAGRAQSEAAWPALIAALARSESAGYSAADALTHVATSRELRAASSVSEILAWRINRHLAVHDVDAPGTAPAYGKVAATSLLPWVPGPQQVTKDGQATQLTAYLSDAAALITRRTEALAGTAVRLRQPWVNALGQPPDDPARADDWTHHVAVVAAYRDQHKVTSDDPRQVLGPYAEPGHAGHNDYWLAADSVLAARRLAGLDPASTATADNRARAQVAADIYRSLPDEERAVVAELVATTCENPWLRKAAHHVDEGTVAKPVHAASLVTALMRHGYLANDQAVQLERHSAPDEEPFEAKLAKRGQPQRSASRPPEGPGRDPRARERNEHHLQPQPRPSARNSGPVAAR